MEAVTFLSKFIDLFTSGFKTFKEKKQKDIDATFLIDKAINKTQNYIAVNKNNYLPSPELSELWTNAANAIFNLDPNLSRMLSEKADFWAYPDRWIDYDIDSTIVTLNYLRQQTEMFRTKLK